MSARHCQGFCFVMKGIVQVFWEAVVIKGKVDFLRKVESQVSVDEGGPREVLGRIS